VGKIAAVDNTLLAARTAQRNVHLNSLADIIVVVNGSAEDFTSQPTDLMVANIHYDVMTSIVESKGFLRQRLFILSGLLNSEADKIVSILNSRGSNIIKRWEAEQTWQTILGSNDPEAFKQITHGLLFCSIPQCGYNFLKLRMNRSVR
jgi:ribosomal protein L11 methyltransferase